MTHPIGVDRVLGQTVWDPDGRRVGRLEECRAIRDREEWFVDEWLIGTAGLLERLGMSALLIAGIDRASGYVARWDQLDFTDPARVRLSCPMSQLQQRHR